MPTNYNILLKSEKKLKELIIDYIELVHEIHFKLWKDIDKYKDDTHMILDNAERRIQRSVVLEEELLDECIWTISKDDPRANHLRFIISIIYSTKDLARACEYAKSIAKIISRKSFNIEIVDSLKGFSKVYLEQIEAILKLYKSSSEDKLEKSTELNSSFENKIEVLYLDYKKQKKDEISNFQISQIVRLVNSTIERIQSIFHSTVFVKKSSSQTKTTKIKIK